MSLYKNASLVMIPSAYKDGKLYSIRPTDGSGDFTFSRGSNLAATRVDVNGLIEKGRENLFIYSNDFNSGWSPKAGTFTQGVTDPNGGSTAWSWTATNTDPYLYQYWGLSGVHCISVWAKGVGSTIGDNIELRIGGSINYFTLTSEWQRFEAFAVLNGATNIGFEYGNPTATSGDVIHIYGAQLELGLVATDYIETGASTAQAGILEDMPRLDYSGGASCPSLLLEPQRTNLITQSEYFADSSYIDNGVSFTLGFLSPDGNLNASKLSEDNTNSIHRFYQTSLVTASPNATISVYVKYNGRRFVLMRIADSGVGRWYDIENGVLGGNFQGTPNDSTIESVGNDWYRITISHSVTSQARFELWVSDTESTSAYQGDVTKGVYLYGAQLELGSYPTSYIPTYGTSQTRSRDICEQLNMSSLFGNAGSTIYFETIYYPETNNGQGERWVYAQGNSSTDYIRLWQDLTGGTKRIRALVRTNDVQQVNITSTATALGLSDTEPSVIKFAFAFAENDFRMYVNGNVRTDTSGVVPPLVEMSFNNTFQTLFPLKQALVFPTALTDSECIALTTL